MSPTWIQYGPPAVGVNGPVRDGRTLIFALRTNKKRPNATNTHNGFSFFNPPPLRVIACRPQQHQWPTIDHAFRMVACLLSFKTIAGRDNT
jgi:hypothetical protein